MKTRKNAKKTEPRAARGGPDPKEARVPVPPGKKRPRRERRQRARKGPWKKGPGGPPFGREFFAETLPGMVQACPCAEGHAPVVTILLGDGHVVDVAGIVTLFERYAIVAAFEGKGDDGIERTPDDIGMEAFPYDLVVRATVRAEPAPHSRFGFGAFAADKRAAEVLRAAEAERAGKAKGTAGAGHAEGSAARPPA